MDDLALWLLNYMRNATCFGELLTAQQIILLEKEDRVEYTLCEETMNELRECYRINAERILAEDENRAN